MLLSVRAGPVVVETCRRSFVVLEVFNLLDKNVSISCQNVVYFKLYKNKYLLDKIFL